MYFFLKRCIDFLCSLLGIVMLSPLFITISIAIIIESRGPIFFKQGRRTKNGKIFIMYKFRSMYINSEKIGSGLFNYKNDPRVTKVGRFIRNTSIDELPQLINVLIGDLSLVGPRPCVSYELGDYESLNSKYKKRFNVKAGITGLAQIRGRNDISWDEKVSFDNEYVDLIKVQGLWLDIKILFITLINIFKNNDIYEIKNDSSLNDYEAAKKAEEEIIRIAHLPDNENYN